MPDCDYCGESFGDEDAYFEHLAAEHDEELGAIDRRRVEQHVGDDDGGLPLGPIILVGLLALSAGAVVYVTWLMGSGASATDELPDSGDEEIISQVETEPSTGNSHVAPGTDIDYERIPPTSGPHYPPGEELPAGFYEEEQDLGAIVHSLEHGAVVVYYDPDSLSSGAEGSLRSFAEEYTDDFGSFIAVPNPNDDPEAPFVVTAWEKRLTLDQYREDAVWQFMAEYLGRGPEGAIR